MNFKKVIMLVALQLTIVESFAQFSAGAEFRPRTEYRHGYNDLIAENEDPGFGISTRARLNLGYKAENYKFYISLQDVLVWGENRQTLPKDLNNSFSIFEVYAKLKINDNFSTKLGRQVLSYDDQRIMGGLDWAQQGRNHDAALIQYKKNNFILDLGFAYNQDYDEISGFQSVGNAYNTKGYFSYKTLFYTYAKQSWQNISGSLLFLNSGFQDFKEDNITPDGLSNLQTFGTHINYKKNKLGIAANLFFQTGKRQGDLDVKGAFLTSLEFNYKASDKINIGIGSEIISGNDGPSGETSAFFPLYGTNHKFNGFMDYFYVGNHANSVGLIDVHASLIAKLGKKSSLFAKVMHFSGQQELPSGERNLGTEVDLVFSQGFNGFSIKTGYSQMFATKGMNELKGMPESIAADIQNWAWLMLVLKPEFL